MKRRLDEAQRSLRTAARDIQAFQVLKGAPEINLASVCFHAQQAVEKLLEAILFLRQVELRRTHDLVELALLLSQHGMETPIAPYELSRLNPFAVTLRYDEMEINIISREEASEWVMLIYHWAEESVRGAMAGPDAPNDD